MKTFHCALGLTALMFVASAAQAQDALQVRSWAAACANCHGTNGVAQSGNESLAGMKKEDIIAKMLDFKNGRKPATVMHQLAKGYSDEQISAIAGYFAAQKK
ncbi:MAG: c-type cytochrome [Ramlibacter sp.]|jgi:sulfide dehydrogenase cytochrome subunit|nr:c-type cytochrome [Ramlibacter sp.]